MQYIPTPVHGYSVHVHTVHGYIVHAYMGTHQQQGQRPLINNPANQNEDKQKALYSRGQAKLQQHLEELVVVKVPFHQVVDVNALEESDLWLHHFPISVGGVGA